MDAAQLAANFERNRPRLLGFLTRLVMRPAVAEELTQTAALRALEARDRAPEAEAEFRTWVMAIGARLGIDALRQHATWRESLLLESRIVAEQTPSFMERSMAMRHAPELALIAKEHLTACLGCTLRSVHPRKAAALLLKEVYGLTVDETADALEVRPAQAKNWIQEARAVLLDRYAQTCALIRKEGVCHQCSELSEVMTGRPQNPLQGTDGSLDARLAVLRETAESPSSPWHRMLMDLLDELAPHPPADGLR